MKLFSAPKSGVAVARCCSSASDIEKVYKLTSKILLFSEAIAIIVLVSFYLYLTICLRVRLITCLINYLPSDLEISPMVGLVISIILFSLLPRDEP